MIAWLPSDDTIQIHVTAPPGSLLLWAAWFCCLTTIEAQHKHARGTKTIAAVCEAVIVIHFGVYAHTVGNLLPTVSVYAESCLSGKLGNPRREKSCAMLTG